MQLIILSIVNSLMKCMYCTCTAECIFRQVKFAVDYLTSIFACSNFYCNVLPSELMEA